jgi:hypothetical protein
MAAHNFYITTIKPHAAFRSRSRIATTELLVPEFRDKIQKILMDSSYLDDEFMVWETYRSKERQLDLFTRGATQLKNVGVHHYGIACDLVRSINGDPSWKGDFSVLGKLAKK